MMERTILKLSVRDEFIVFQTYSRRNVRSSQFYMAADVLETMETKGVAVAMDDPHFVKLHTYVDRAGVERLCMQFTWLSVSGHDGVHGRREFLDVDHAKFKAAMEKSRARQEAWQTLLSLPEEGKPPIRMNSKGNLKKVLENRTLKKKLGRFLASNFKWKSAKCIHVSDDYLPYSFFFWEERDDGRGICGGIILHEREDLRRAHYEIHT